MANLKSVCNGSFEQKATAYPATQGLLNACLHDGKGRLIERLDAAELR